MRTALVLLFLLAVAAVPGSALPQRTVSVEQVQNYYLDNPDLAPWLDRLYLFDVYSSPWFAAIYLLLVVSLVGCVVPRAAKHYRAMRARPPRAPHDFSRLPYSARFTTDAAPEQVLTETRRVLRRYRADVREGSGEGEASVAAERGHLREVGNLAFHVSIVALLAALAVGSLLGYRGNMLLVEGEGFANAVPSYDAFQPGAAVGPGQLQPFTIWLEDFEASFIEEGDLAGQAEHFTAQLRYREEPEGPELHHTLEVNHPLAVDGAQVYLLGFGYAPEFTVTDSTGEVVFDQAVPFLPRDEFTFASDGVVKVPEASPEQLGFTAEFSPSVVETPEAGLASDFPAPRDPAVILEAYEGDLGLDSGDPQSVYRLYASRMDDIGTSEVLRPGDTWELADGTGTVTFEGYQQYVTLQVTSDPGRVGALLAAAVAVAGLLATLLVRPRRYWVRVRTGEDGRSAVEVAGLDKTGNDAADEEFHRITVRLKRRLDGPDSQEA
jgi:cytochrome c biogenesis protein